MKFLLSLLMFLAVLQPAKGDILDAKTKCDDDTLITTTLENGTLNVIYRGDRSLKIPLATTVLDFLFLNFSRQTLLEGLSFTLEPDTLYGYSFEPSVIMRTYSAQLEIHYKSLATIKKSYWFPEARVDGVLGFYWLRSEPRNLALKLITLRETYYDVYTDKVYEIDNTCKVRN